MTRFAVFKGLIFFCIASIAGNGVFAQPRVGTVKSQELSDDGSPVLIKHLPDWESKRTEAKFASDLPTLKNALGNRPILDLIDFAGGTEAVTAPYPAGTLLIVEFTNPQASIGADSQVLGFLSQNPESNVVYRRVGNYNVFVFDAADPSAAAALIDQVKYEKNIQWLGEDPFLLRRLERDFVNTSADIFVSTAEWIVLGMGSTLLAGLILGYSYFRFRARRRLAMNEFSDAGGMVRLNLDGLTPEISAGRLLNE